MVGRSGGTPARLCLKCLASLPGVTDGGAGHVTSSPANSVLQVDSGMPQAQGKKTSISFSGDTGIGAERRSRTMRRISLIVILVAIAALLIGVLVYAINR